MMQKYSVALFLLSSVLSPSHAAPQNSVSEWSSGACSSVAIGPGDELSHLQRVYLVGQPGLSIQHKYYADALCKLPLYTLVIQGRAEPAGEGRDYADHVAVKVTLDRVLFTLDSPRGATLAKSCADGVFEVGVQRDVSDSACLFMKPKARCGTDFDIVKIKDGVMTTGFRTADMCSAQGLPTRLQSAGAAYVEQFN
ncbi:MAG: hypothetical protein V4484_13505 [Pseudomonadota bacterium]